MQVITPGVVTPESHFFADSAWTAVAVHEGGGPTSAVASTVTSLEGVKPCAPPLPEKYAPLLSAANCSSYVARLRRSDFIAATYALSFVFANFGIAIAARMPMMTTTIKSSISVKPFLLRIWIKPLRKRWIGSPRLGRRECENDWQAVGTWHVAGLRETGCPNGLEESLCSEAVRRACSRQEGCVARSDSDVGSRDRVRPVQVADRLRAGE